MPVNTQPLSVYYSTLASSGQIQDDSAQREVLNALESLRLELEGEAKPGLFRRKNTRPGNAGVYIWGNVGRGKSMLMQLFFDHVRVPRKRRVHFHAFMQEVHARMHQYRKDGADPVVMLAQQLAGETSLLCFDELQATDVADATLLFRLFSQLFEAGVTIVSTSNHPPGSLYTGGVQRERFDKFIALIEERMQVVALSNPHDYRQMQIKSFDKRYVWPLGQAADLFIDQAIAQLCTHLQPKQAILSVLGRQLEFLLYDEEIGRFTFADLCESPLGAPDYLALAKRCDTVILTGIPRLSPEKRNEAKRFVTLIDALYEQRVKLLSTAEVPPEQIYAEGDGSFEFSRTISRLAEMQSAHWGE